MDKKKLIVFTGAGISKESGIDTFRDSDGMWESHNVMDVAHIDGWKRDRGLVLDFYNDRRRKLVTVLPNKAHFDISGAEKFFDVTVITQNVDDLHERGGSKNIIHLHGELTKAKSSLTSSKYVKDLGYNDIVLGDKCPDGAQLRPDIVWFGEAVPTYRVALSKLMEADYVLVVGTSLNVEPAASLIAYGLPTWYVDSNADENLAKYWQPLEDVKTINKPATEGVSVALKLIEEYG